MTWRRVMVAVVTVSALVVGGAGTTQARAATVLPPDSMPFGRTYGEWSAAWWQRMFAIPKPHNPLLHPTGANCRRGAAGEVTGAVFFLAGSQQGDTQRTCVVPADTAI